MMSYRLPPFAVIALLLVTGCAPEPSLRVALGPATATTADNLLASIETESGQPAEGSFQFSWQRDGTVQEELAGLNLIPASHTSRDDRWQVFVTAIRGDSEPLQLQSNTVEIVNTPPSIASVIIAPAEPTAATELSAEVLGYEDLDGDGPSYNYTWFVDGVATGEDLGILAIGLFVRDQQVQVEVMASDGEEQSTPVLSELITIGNSAPSAPVIAIVPVHPVGSQDSLQCSVLDDALDVDQDSLSYELDWLVDGGEYPGDPIASGWAGPATTLLDGDTVPAEDASPGEEWTCTLRARDALAASEVSYSVVLAEQDETISDFGLVDTNTLSPTSGEPVSPRDYLCKVSGWYFGHST
jgi:hypothetical protein